MKLTFFLLTVTFLQVSATGTAQTVTYHGKNVKLLAVFDAVEQQTGYAFFYNDADLKKAKPVSVSLKGVPLPNALEIILRGQPFDFSISGKTIVINWKAEDSRPKLSIEQLISTFIEITGQVSSETGEPLAGATVAEKGTAKSVVTKDDGSFSISTSGANPILVVSYVGFTTKEIPVNNQSSLRITLRQISASLNDVIVVGYGTQRKRDITGATATVRSEQLTQVPVMSPEYALQGRASGVQVMQTNGAPGGAVQVSIRGVNGIAAGGNQPLYVVDGVPLFNVPGELVASAGSSGTPENNTSSPLSTINPNDIENIEILKDASATAIYGSRAANGVVLITTKSGKAGKTSFNVDYYYGLQTMQRKWDLLNGIEGMVLRKEAMLNTRSDITRNIPAEMFNPFALASSTTYKNYDWQDVLFRTAPIQDANLSASGGTEAIRYLASGNYFNQQGIFVNTSMKRYSARLNLDVKASKRLNFGLRNAVSNQNGNNVTDGNPFQGTLIGSLFYPQYMQPYNPDGTFFGPPHTVGGTWDSRNFLHEAMDFTRNVNRFRYNGNVWGEIGIVDGLKFRSQFGIDFNTLENKRFNPAIPRGPAFIVSGPDLGANNTSRAYLQQVRAYNWVADQLLTYSKTFQSVHQLNAILGFSAQSFTTKSLISQGEGSLNPLLTLVGTNNGQNISVGEGYSKDGLVSQFARVNYSFDDKYLLTGTVRRDGSSNFGPDNRYGYFPAASFGWRISKESFLRNVDFISDLKLRVSYGVVGNQNIGSFQFIPRMTGANTVFGSTFANGFTINGIANERLKWEENEKKDLGIDLSILKGRVDITADYFINTSKGILLSVPIPQFSGFGTQTLNVGSIENKGWELAVTSRNIEGKFRWTTNVNISSIKNKVLDLGTGAQGGGNEYAGIALFTQGSPFGNINITRAGWPIGSFYGLQTAGIARSSAEAAAAPVQTGVRTLAGDVLYVDQNKDGLIDEKDRVYLGSPFPDFFGGLSNELSYRNFSLNILANFVVGQEMFNYARLRLQSFGDPWGSAEMLKRYTAENASGNYPRMVLGNVSGYNRINSDRWIDDASFLRVRNITLGYTLPANLLSKAHLQYARVYVSGSNLFTVTKYEGWDPEAMSSGNNVLSGGIDQGSYPVARTISLGINCRF